MTKENVRLKALRIENRKSQNDIAVILGISQGAYSQIETGNTALSIDQGLRLGNLYNVTLDWLATGNGSRIPTTSPNGFIPLVDARIHAGYIRKGSEILEENIEMFRIPGFLDGAYRIFEVEGKSMSPTLVPNDYLICTELKRPYNFVDGTICAVVTHHEIFVKRAYVDINDSEKLIMKCDNSLFPTESIPLNEIKEMWTVSAKLTTTFVPPNEDHESRMQRLEEKLHFLELTLKAGHDGEDKP